MFTQIIDLVSGVFAGIFHFVSAFSSESFDAIYNLSSNVF